MASYLYFILGAAIGSVVFGLLAWCEELKCKRIDAAYKDSVQNQQVIYTQSIQKQKDIYEKAVKELDEFYQLSLKEIRKELLSNQRGLNKNKKDYNKDLN